MADFGTSNNIEFTFSIIRTENFLSRYYNSCKISCLCSFSVVSLRKCVEDGSFGVRAGANFDPAFLRRRCNLYEGHIYGDIFVEDSIEGYILT